MVRNVLTINTANSGGGAEKVAYTLCKELHLRGLHSKMLARRIDYNADPLARELVIPVPGSDTLYSAGNFLDDVFSTQYLFYLPTWKIPFMDVVKQADVVHLHNMHGYYFNLLTIPLLMKKKPVVWTFHDMWAFTGKCSHAFECERYTNSCGECPQLAAYPMLPRDTTRFHIRLKRWLYGKRDFIIVSPSEWLKNHIQRSFLKDICCEVIPSPVNTNVFYPESKQLARQKLGIPTDKKVLLFVASWVNSIYSKGIHIFKEILDALTRERNDIYALIVGHLEGQSVLQDRYEGKETGWVSDAETLRACYSSADVFVSPTLAENSSCTIIEAMACGTVPVAFNVGGVPEQIADGKTGVLIRQGETQALVHAIMNIIEKDNFRTQVGQNAAQWARNQYSVERFVDKHLEIYEEARRRN